MSPLPPTRNVPVLGTPSLSSTKCALGASSRVFFARLSRSGADSSDPPLQLTRPASTAAASSGATARRSGMDPPPRVGADSSAPGRSGAGAGTRGDPLRHLRLGPEREEGQRGLQLGESVLLGRGDPEGLAHRHPVAGALDDRDVVAGPELAGSQDPEVGAGGAARGEALHQVGDAPVPGEAGARSAPGGHLEQRRPDPPPLPEDGAEQVEAAGAQVLAEPAGGQLTAELPLPPAGVLLA